MQSAQAPVFLVLNTRGILDRLPEWFPDARGELVVATTRSALAGARFLDVARRFRHLHIVEDFDHPDVEDELAGLCGRFRVERVLSTGERDLLCAARLRERLGLPGQDVAGATAYRDKYVMKSVLRAAGVPVAPMRRIFGPDELEGFIGTFGYSVVARYLESTGSATLRVPGDTMGAPARTTYPPRRAEAWVEGAFYQVNGLMDSGRIVLGQPSHHPYSDWFSLAFDAPSMSGMLPAGHPLGARLLESAAAVIAALPAVPGLSAFRTEFFHTADDRLVLGEAACRPGDSPLVDTHEAALGVNLHRATLLGQAGRGHLVALPDPAAAPRPRLGYAGFPPARGVLRELPRHCPLPRVVSYTARGEVGRAYDGARSLGPRIAEVVFTLSGPDVGAELREFEEWWDNSVVWEERGTASPWGYAPARGGLRAP
ncbi:hypothetical protein ABZ951_12805 [Streptomyces sp. NPDC046215]|uniref:ATP-grasp domain-containing protein n=1 Tax=Streptomyces stramineus TaxID=173861 RepID=A0ABP3JUM1_9ACTN